MRSIFSATRTFGYPIAMPLNLRLLRHWLIYPFSRRERIHTKMLNGFLTVNQAREMLGLPRFVSREDDRWANSYIRADRRGFWFLEER